MPLLYPPQGISVVIIGTEAGIATQSYFFPYELTVFVVFDFLHFNILIIQSVGRLDQIIDRTHFNSTFQVLMD